MIEEIVQFRDIDNLHIKISVSDHHQFHAIDDKILVLDIVNVIENSILREIYHIQDAQTFIRNEKMIDHLTFLPLEIIVIVLFLDPTLEIDSSSEFIFPLIDLHQDHFPDLHLDLEDLLSMYNQLPLKILTTTQETSQSRKTNDKNVQHETSKTPFIGNQSEVPYAQQCLWVVSQ